MIRSSYPFFNKRYAYDNNTNLLHDLKNETIQCKIDEIDEELIEVYSSLQEACLIVDHPVYKCCPHCMNKDL
jgi:hypothetical protein